MKIVIVLDQDSGVYYLSPSDSGAFRKGSTEFQRNFGSTLEGKTMEEIFRASTSGGVRILLMDELGFVRHLMNRLSKGSDMRVLRLGQDILREASSQDNSLKDLCEFIEELTETVEEKTVKLVSFLKEGDEISPLCYKVFLKRYLERKTYKKIGEEVGRSTERVRQLYKR